MGTQSQGRSRLDGTTADEEPNDPTRPKQFTAPQSYWEEKLRRIPGDSDSARIRFVIDWYLEAQDYGKVSP